jgi:hypothetical protein
MEQMEMIYQSQELANGWAGIGSHKTWWFDTAEQYSKIYTLDRQGIPIVWDDEVFGVEETRQSTKDDTCTIILKDKKKKVLILIHKDLDHVLIQGAVDKKVSWEDYNTLGLWAIKKHCTGFELEAVIFNPKIKTLEKFGIIKSIIKKIIETRDLIKGKDHEPAQKKDKED